MHWSVNGRTLTDMITSVSHLGTRNIQLLNTDLCVHAHTHTHTRMHSHMYTLTQTHIPKVLI